MPIFASRTERLLFLASAASGFGLACLMPVFSQECYYWTYAQHPDLSYFDHPPMVAWLIWLGTALLGDGALGIRLATCACGIGIVLAGLLVLGEFQAGARARFAWLVLTWCVPSLVVVGFLANPDPPLSLFWMLTMATLWKARSGHLGWWAAAGFMAGGALLSKYTAIFLAFTGLALLVADPQMRRQWRRPGPYLGVLIAAITFSPVIWWNVANDFESFRFQTEGRWQHAALGINWFGQFVGGQLLVLNPAVAILLPASLWWLWRRHRSADLRGTWLLAFSVPYTAFLLGTAAFVQVKINWLAPAVAPLLLGLSLWWAEQDFAIRRPRLAKRLLVTAVVIGVIAHLAPLVHFLPQSRGTSWEGWGEIAECAERWETKLDAEDKVAGNVFFFAADYRDAAQLGRSLKLVAGHEADFASEPTFAQNVFGMPALQFDHWVQPATRIGQDAIFVLPRPQMRDGMLKVAEQHFQSVERVEQVTVERLGIEVLQADVFVCRGYRGPKLPN